MKKNAHTIYELFAKQIADLAINEAAYSNLPGKENGPYDAYRHLLWSAENARFAKTIVASGIGAMHEIDGLIRENQPWENSVMDFSNNNIGYKIGSTSNSWEEVVQRCRSVIALASQNIEADGSVKLKLPNHLANGFVIMPETKWSGKNNNPAPRDHMGNPMPKNEWNWPSPKFPQNAYPNKKWYFLPDGNMDWNREIFLRSQLDKNLSLNQAQFANFNTLMLNLAQDMLHLPIQEQAYHTPNQFGFSQAALDSADKMMQERLAQNQNQNQSQGRSLG